VGPRIRGSGTSSCNIRLRQRGYSIGLRERLSPSTLPSEIAKEKENAAVWALDQWWLNKRVLGEREVVAPGAKIGISQPDADRYRPWRFLRLEQNIGG
jgi:hypothetical protein